jgi:nitroimidazol reductase NimA-like FMN-containing flavoprotein (pyridoxamine 5'-phosphate oxidase superfamily)
MAFNESLSHLLEERRIATLTTFGENDMPHVTAVWFLWQEGALYIATSHMTGKGRNLSRDSRMALCIESREDGREAGLSASGNAELLTGDSAAPMASSINGKYLTPKAMEHPVVGAAFIGMSDLVVKLVPEKWISWDMASMGEELFTPDMDISEYFYPTLK